MRENKDFENSSFNNEEDGRNSSSSDKLNRGYMDITLNSSYGSANKKSKVNIDSNKNKNLDAFLQGAYSRTVAVSHNYSCTFHSMGRNILEMYLEDKKSNVSNGLGERIIRKLLEKHGKKLKNPVWAHAGWHPFGSSAYRKSFWESVKYYFSNATWGWLNLFNPFFWLSELIWGEYKNDIYQYKNEIKLLIGESLYESEKYRIGNILGQLIREEIATEIGKLREKLANYSGNVTEEEGEDGFTTLNMENSNNWKVGASVENTFKSKSPTDMIHSINGAANEKKFDEPYVPQEKTLVAYEWQYLTSKDFLEEQKNEEEKQNGELSKTIIFEVKNKTIVFSEGNEVSNYCLSDDNDMEEIKSKLDIKTQKVDSYLVCVMSSGFSMGRCQPIVGTKNKNEFINEFIKVLETNNETTYDYLNSPKNERMNDNFGNTKNKLEK